MNAKLTFLAVGCAAVAATGCHHRIMYPPTPGKSTVKIATGEVTASADPDILYIRTSDFVNGNFTVKWQAPTSTRFLSIQFDPTDYPCPTSSITTHGSEAECVLNVYKMKPDHIYKYVVIVDFKVSRDPGIAHSTGRGKPPRPPARPPVTLFCLDLSKGSPESCKNGDRPKESEDANPLEVSPLDNIYFQAGSDWSVAVDAGVCEQTQISSSSQPYCTVNKEARPATYNYRVTVNGTTKGPFQIQVK